MLSLVEAATLLSARGEINPLLALASAFGSATGDSATAEPGAPESTETLLARHAARRARRPDLPADA